MTNSTDSRKPSSTRRLAVVYVRVSSARQVENFSLGVQEQACRDYCRRQGWEVLRVFREQGESARTADRTQLNELLNYCRENKRSIPAVVVHAVSRWSRDTRDHYALTGYLLKLGIGLRSATEPISDDPAGQLMEAVIAGVAKFENQLRANRTTSGMRKALEGGRWVHRAPLGYLNGGRGNRGQPSLVPNPATANIVRECFTIFANEGLSGNDVQRRLATRGFNLPDGKPMSIQTVNKTLRNPIYAGFVRLASWGVSVRGDFEPLVTEQVFNRVQARLAGNGAPKAHVRDSDDFPLRGFVRCSACDKPLTGAMSSGRSKQYGFYWCYRCNRVRVSKATLEAAFVDLLGKLRPRHEYIRLFRTVVLDVWSKRTASAREERERLERQVSAVRTKLDRISDLVADGTLDARTYERQRDRLHQDLAVSESKLDETVTEQLDVEGVLGFAETVLTDASRLWEHTSPDNKRRLQRTLFPEGVTYEPGTAGGLRTAVTCLAFNGLSDSQDAELSLVALRGFEPRFDD